MVPQGLRYKIFRVRLRFQDSATTGRGELSDRQPAKTVCSGSSLIFVRFYDYLLKQRSSSDLTPFLCDDLG